MRKGNVVIIINKLFEGHLEIVLEVSRGIEVYSLAKIDVGFEVDVFVNDFVELLLPDLDSVNVHEVLDVFYCLLEAFIVG